MRRRNEVNKPLAKRKGIMFSLFVVYRIKTNKFKLQKAGVILDIQKKLLREFSWNKALWNSEDEII